jgi:hypothetical protein
VRCRCRSYHSPVGKRVSRSARRWQSPPVIRRAGDLTSRRESHAASDGADHRASRVGGDCPDHVANCVPNRPPCRSTNHPDRVLQIRRRTHPLNHAADHPGNRSGNDPWDDLRYDLNIFCLFVLSPFVAPNPHESYWYHADADGCRVRQRDKVCRAVWKMGWAMTDDAPAVRRVV